MLNEALSKFGLDRKNLIGKKDFLSKSIRRRLAFSYFCKKHGLTLDDANRLFFTRVIAKELNIVNKS